MFEEQKRGVLRCKQGDLAIVTKCSVAERIGLIVRVLGRSGNGRHDWLTEIQGEGVIGRGIESGQIRKLTRALMYDWNLTPINGAEPLCQKARSDALRIDAMSRGER